MNLAASMLLLQLLGMVGKASVSRGNAARSSDIDVEF
jgi:hypothetical protein